jgi:protoporphyrinogen oxidase
MADNRRDNASAKPDAVIAEGDIAGLNASAKPHAVMAKGSTAGRDKAGAYLASEAEVLRCTIGRFGAEHLLQRDDADLAALSACEVAEAFGASGAPAATRVSRWDDALPRYTVGHRDRVKQIRETVAALPGLAVCGALYDGVGVGVGMTTARGAADQVRTWLTNKENGTS